jgi:HIV Tat-specific factor 1
LISQQQQAYAVPGVDDSETTTVKSPTAGSEAGRKRKDPFEGYENAIVPESQNNGDAKKLKSDNGPVDKSRKKKPRERQEPKNRAVYITNLPIDTTMEELHTIFSRCGVIAETLEDRTKPRIKLYTDPATGSFKGDALVIYFRPESVQLAIQMLDDTDLRFGQEQEQKMRVQEAGLGYKKEPLGSGGAGAENGEAKDGEKKEERSKVELDAEKKRIKKKRDKMIRYGTLHFSIPPFT